MKLTKQERADFTLFCEQATPAQLDAIILKEVKARRRPYANIARKVRDERNERHAAHDREKEGTLHQRRGR